MPSTTPLEEAFGAAVVNRSSVAALACLVYDILLTMDEEVQLIWPKPWAFTKIIFFFIRYFAVAVQVSILFIGTELTPAFHFTPHDCYIWQVYQGLSALLLVIAVDVILVLRVRVMYNSKPLISTLLALSFLVEITGMIVSLILTVPGIEFNDICLVTTVPGTIIIYGAAWLLFQTLLLGLTLSKFYSALKQGWGNIPVIRLLARDGTWGFILIFMVLVGEFSLFALKNHALSGVLYGWLLSTFSFVGYRILLNLQTLSPENIPRTENVESYQLATMSFIARQGNTDEDEYCSSGAVESQIGNPYPVMKNNE